MDEQRIEVVRALFRLVGQEGRALWAIKRAFDAAGIETRAGGYWHVSTLRDMTLNDVYLAHTPEQLRGLGVTEEVLSSLDPDALRSLVVQHPTRRDLAERQAAKDLATPRGLDTRPDTRCWGAPRLGCGREGEDTGQRTRPSSAGHREWILKGLSYCACGSRLKPFTARRPALLYGVREPQERQGPMLPRPVPPGHDAAQGPAPEQG